MSPAVLRGRAAQQVFSLSLRLLSLFSKFLIVLLMAKYLSARELGVYGLIASGTGYLLLLVGLDFYTYTTREMLAAPREAWTRMLRSQGALMLVQYLLVLVGVAVALVFFEPGLVLWFGAILLLEHLTQEFNRLFVTMERQVTATVILFFRAGGWCLAAIPVLVLLPAARRLEVVLGLWVGSLLVGAALGAVLLLRERLVGWRGPVDWSWVRRGLAVALPLLLATLSVRALLNLDRFVVQGLGGLEVVGAYVLFMGIAAALLALIESGVVVYFYPAMVRAVAEGQPEGLSRAMRQMALAVAVVAVPYVAGTMLVRDLLVSLLDDPIYAAHTDLLLPALLAMTALGLSLVPHYGLYAHKRDRALLVVNVVMAAGFGLGCGVLLWLDGPVVAVPWIMTGCLVAGGVLKLVVFQRVRRTTPAVAPVA